MVSTLQIYTQYLTNDYRLPHSAPPPSPSTTAANRPSAARTPRRRQPSEQRHPHLHPPSPTSRQAKRAHSPQRKPAPSSADPPRSTQAASDRAVPSRARRAVWAYRGARQGTSVMRVAWVRMRRLRSRREYRLHQQDGRHRPVSGKSRLPSTYPVPAGREVHPHLSMDLQSHPRIPQCRPKRTCGRQSSARPPLPPPPRRSGRRLSSIRHPPHLSLANRQ